ncbi:MAG: ATP-binding cassette domain-containing protein [Bacteroidetes bacterium]|nr:ATP-binding cassette domain-containing protein [Bacteroidota bacterium]MBS1541499.1 ATP-binding cassette domain-containing protein [Bacteroidota bacterium]
MKIVTENLGKRFNREWIFRNFSHIFETGKRYAITGPNGSGKSTLMQVLWGQMQPSTGAISYFPTPHDVHAPIEQINPSDLFKRVAIAAPYMDLIEEFSLPEMIRFHFKFKTCRLPLDLLIDKINLPANPSKPISQYSSGMRQRLKLGLAFYSKADFLFLDEPCTNLDQASAQWYHDQLSEVPTDTITFIASNLEHEYASADFKINIFDYK